MNQPFTNVILISFFLSACSSLERHNTDKELAIQHQSLAMHFESEATEIKAKLEEHKKFLTHFESKRYVYGRHAEDFKLHSQKIIKIYEQAIVANKEMSEMLRANGN